jgi:GT2 family glycosyltransferase
MKSAVVILNWNGKQHLEQYLPSVVEHTQLSDIIVADNCSTDTSVDFLKANFPQVKLLHNTKNFGFAKGYNEALKKIEGHYDVYLLINSDIEVTPNWEKPLLDVLSERKEAVVCQPKILSHSQKDRFEYAGASGGYIDCMGYTFCRGRLFETSEKDNLQYETKEDIFWASGACFAVKANLFHQLDGFDEDIYAHMEEIDFCWRLQQRGYKIFVEPQSTVYHLGGGSLQYDSPFKSYLNFRNNLLLLVKNDFSKWLFFKLIFRMKLDGLAAIRLLLKGKPTLFFSIIHAHFGFYKRLPKFLKKRKHNQQHLQPNTLVGKYNRLLIWDYFVSGKRKFSELNQKAFNR